MKAFARRSWAASLPLLCLLGACAQVLDIEGAHLDPTLNAGSGGAGAGGLAANESGAPGSGGDKNSFAGDAGATSEGGKAGKAGAENGGQNGAEPTAGSLMSSAGAGEQQNICESYCDAVISNCKGKYEQYRTFDQCIQVCKRLPPGEVGDENMNSVECRIRQARFAESEPFVYCKSAGPLGAGKCSSNCVSYCSLMDQTCTAKSTDGNLELSYFHSTSECLTACEALPPDPSGPTQYSSSAVASPSSYVGNNVFCRTYHVAAALEQDAPTEHCPHAMGGDPCNAE